ncbi:MAG: glycosyltransferase family 4 protein [Anaerolineae bacterium]|nr:glycosyltransferase family 4 protein [Anaerolineae bacterium]
MDILFIAQSPPYPPHMDDRGVIYYLAREYERRHHVVDLVCFYDEPEQIADVPRYAHFFREVKLVSSPTRTPDHLQQRLRKKNARFPKNDREAWSPEMWRTIEALLHNRPYLMVYLFGGLDVYEYHPLVQDFSTLCVPFAAQSYRLPARIAGASRTEKKPLEQFLNVVKPYESWIYEPFGCVVVHTDADANYLTKTNSSFNVHVIPMGVDVDYFVPTGYSPLLPALLFMGDFASKDQRDAAIQLCKHIYPHVRRSSPNLELYIVGDNPPPELRAYASEQIHITGHVLDVRPFFELASVYVSPVLRQTGMNKYLLQALAMMTPVVATPQSCEGLTLRHEQHGLIGETVEELTRAVQRLLQSQQLYQRLQHDGRDLINQHYTWQRVADRFHHLHNSIR